MYKESFVSIQTITAYIVSENSSVLTTKHATGPIKANCICTSIAVYLIKRLAERLLKIIFWLIISSTMRRDRFVLCLFSRWRNSYRNGTIKFLNLPQKIQPYLNKIEFKIECTKSLLISKRIVRWQQRHRCCSFFEYRL